MMDIARRVAAQKQNHADMYAMLDRLYAAGIRLEVDNGWNWKVYLLSMDEVMGFIQDPDGFFAAVLRIEKSRYLEWKKYMESNGQCTGMTVKDRQCEKCGENCPDPTNFIPGISDRCWLHVDIV